MANSFDLVVVGTGAGGSAPASRCRAAGWSVAVVDVRPYGGTCALRGCDPKKVLVGATEAADLHERLAGNGLAGEARIDWPALVRFKRTFTDPVPGRREAAFEEAGVATLHGTARFVAEDCLVVGAREIEARHVVLAVGAAPVPLGIPGEEHVCTSTDFLELDTLPARIAFVGGGYIAFEFAHISQRAGAQAMVLGRGAPLARFDSGLVERLVARTRDLGVEVRTGTTVTAVERTADGFLVHTEGPGGAGVVIADLVVHAAGRAPNLGGLDLHRGNVRADARAGVAVNEYLQSVTNSRVYATGDAALPAGSLPLTPVAAHEGAVVASNLLHGNAKCPDYRGVPSVVFTVPPLASVGLTEAEARDRGLEVRVQVEDTGDWYANRRVREPAGMTKTIVDTRTDRVLGAHLLGPNADEVINLFALAVRHGLTATDLRHMTYAYPTHASDVVYML
ncbi:NAD(P)/FAD-dependent oxidoreductase [Longimicrobium sp.]|uniref:dihydrolipoyl dehydrogenase family protein n=1 Tax=Longimicrobium sp. TaxID=2029185 RepID=UPI002E33A501|nr:NAD(P)/FAD-dependent oxidoreductase [Longimicrobium sp.]HEX6037754.1 NAD(P)/FAD-dependent oxidoreductase [Longimicrobium sp.]